MSNNLKMCSAMAAILAIKDSKTPWNMRPESVDSMVESIPETVDLFLAEDLTESFFKSWVHNLAEKFNWKIEDEEKAADEFNRAYQKVRIAFSGA